MVLMKKESEETMLVNSNIDLRWSVLPQSSPADYLLLLSALDDGWKVMETAFLDHNISKAYLVTLFHPRRALVRQVTVSTGPEADLLLKDDIDTIIHRYEQAPASAKLL